MSFSFGFGGEEYSDDEADDVQLTKSTQELNIHDTIEHVDASPALPARHHSLAELMALLPLSLAYSIIQLDDGTCVPRRELWDIKHQLMSGSALNASDHQSNGNVEAEEEETMKFMGSDDVIKGIYEGGFKTWECSLDLANHLASEKLPNTSTIKRRTVIELGCGTSIPSVVVLMHALNDSRPSGGLTLIVQDYNLSVLQLCTLPNLFLGWYLSRRQSTSSNQPPTSDSGTHDDESSNDMETGDGEVVIDDSLVNQFLTSLSSSNISIHGSSGSWSPEMYPFLHRPPSSNTESERNEEGKRGDGEVLVLASETIYSVASLPSFVNLLKSIIAPSDESGRVREALVAAKQVYFGVGGGIQEFIHQVTRRPSTLTQSEQSEQGDVVVRATTVVEKSEGVKRIIIRVSK